MKIISASLSPNTDIHDVLVALRVLFTPWTWKIGSSQDRVEKWFQKEYDVKRVYFFQSGRIALYELLKAYAIGKNDEVLVQAFTCVAVPNSVKWAGATPVFVDIDKSLNMDSNDAEKKITKRTKALVVQHTFGIPADMTRIMKVAKKYHLIVIEDCAHAIGATYEGKKLGTIGDAAFFSFGRDKVISSVWGGAAFLRNNRQLTTSLPWPNYYWIFQQLLHPIIFSVILPTYRIGIGKVILVAFQRLKLLSKPVDSVELSGGLPKGYMTKYPNGLAQLLEAQLAKLPTLNRIRNQNVQYFERNLSKNIQRILSRPGASYVRYPILVDDPIAYRKTAGKNGILLGNWYHHVIDPNGVDYSSIHYETGTCPHAEKVASRILNLPTLLTAREASMVLEYVS